jgi:hypothetical protein
MSRGIKTNPQVGIKTKHCKREYKVIQAYNEIDWIEVVEVNGKEYEILRNPRPTKTEAELMCVFVQGIKYASFAKFLKSVY